MEPTINTGVVTTWPLLTTTGTATNFTWKLVPSDGAAFIRAVRDEVRAPKPYGNVTYADPKNGKYPIDTKAHAKAAWSYINVAGNAAKYPLNGVSLSSVKSKIKAACAKFGVAVSTNSRPNIGECVRSFDFRAAGESGDGRTLEGHAAVFNTPAKIRDMFGDFEEVILPGAFERSLKQRKPIMQYDHGRDARVGSVPIATIEDVHEDDVGLYVRARLFDNTVVEPVRQAIAGGAIKGMSFRFQVPDGGDTWSEGGGTGGMDKREIRDTDTSEIGPVAFPAYDTTSVTVRSLLAQLDPVEHRALIRELAEELRLDPDLTDFIGRPVTRSSGGDEPVQPASSAATDHVLYDELIFLRKVRNEPKA